MKYKQFGKTDTQVPAIGQGTAYSTNSKPIPSIVKLRIGIKYGMTFIDTAENYYSEELIGQAVKDCRKEIFITTKVSPEHLSYNDVLASADGSLRRLQTDYIDLYLIHWPNPAIPLEETLRAMEKLAKDGKVRYIGVSNFSLRELKKANAFLNGKITSVEMEYNLLDRAAEENILPYCEKKRISVIAYSPLDHGRIFEGDGLKRQTITMLAKKYNKTGPQITLRWLISQPQVIAIPLTTNIKHIKENASATDFDLTKEDIDLINNTFKTPCFIIPTNQIKVDRNGLDKFVPSPNDLAKEILNGETLKMIRVRKSEDENYDYDLVEGKVRYWAWVIAHDGKVPIRALVR